MKLIAIMIASGVGAYLGALRDPLLAGVLAFANASVTAAVYDMFIDEEV